MLNLVIAFGDGHHIDVHCTFNVDISNIQLPTLQMGLRSYIW
jgi:hypothetical protein